VITTSASRTAEAFALGAPSLLIHLVWWAPYGWFRDELYYIACGMHLDWGYVDHAPLIGWFGALVHLCGDSLFVARAIAALAGAITVALTALLVREFGGGRFAQILACVCVTLSPIRLGGDHLFTMNAFEPALWTAMVLTLVRRNWIAFGVVAGVALMNKHSTLFFGFALVFGLLATERRKELLEKRAWIGVAIAAAIFAPNVIWQWRHGWPTIAFLEAARSVQHAHMGAGTFLKEQVLEHGPIAAPVWIIGVVWSIARGERFVGVAYVVLMTIFVATHVKPYYPAPAYPALFAAGAVAIAGVTKRAAIPAIVAAGDLVLAPVAFPVLPVEAYLRYEKTIGIQAEFGEKYQRKELPQLYADMHGWPELAARTRAAFDALPPDEREHAVVIGSSYGAAAAAEVLARLPAASGNTGYGLWGPPEGRGDVAIGVNMSRRRLEEIYEEVVVVDVVSTPYARERDVEIVVCRKPKMPLREAWPRLVRYA
jgi:hypothetical protein